MFRFDHLSGEVSVALVGKYTMLHDSYLSISKAVNHASMACNRKVCIRWIEASDLDMSETDTDDAKHAAAWETLKSCEYEHVSFS